MVAEKTEFLDGTQLFYPLGILPKLFASIDTQSRKGFIEKLAKLDGPDGEGTPLDTLIEFVRIGMLYDKPTLSYEDAEALVSKYYEKYGYEALEMVVTEAFANSLLTDKELLERNKKLLEEIKEVQFQQVETALKKKKEMMTKISKTGSRKSRG